MKLSYVQLSIREEFVRVRRELSKYRVGDFSRNPNSFILPHVNFSPTCFQSASVETVNTFSNPSKKQNSLLQGIYYYGGDASTCRRICILSTILTALSVKMCRNGIHAAFLLFTNRMRHSCRSQIALRMKGYHRSISDIAKNKILEISHRTHQQRDK